MATSKNSFFDRLNKLFSTQSIIRDPKTKKIKVIDVNRLQAVKSFESNRAIDRYMGLRGTAGYGLGYDPSYGFQTLKQELYKDYEVMDNDSILASALDIYADESTLQNEYGEMLKITSDSDEIRDSLTNLFYDVLNIEFNLWPWVRNICKYGDFYLKLDIVEHIGVTNVIPLSSYYVIREEDPTNPDSVIFRYDASDGVRGMFPPDRNGKRYFENYEIAHFRLLSDMNYLPYGKSMLEAARKVWGQLTLMEDAMMIHRIMRAPQKRLFKIDVGGIPPNSVDTYMNEVIDKMKKVPYIDEQTGDYNLKFNLQNMLEDFFMPVRGGQSGTEITDLGGMEWTGTEDIQYLRNRMLAALKIPKAFLGYEEELNSKCLSLDTLIPLLSGDEKTIRQLIEDHNNGVQNYVFSIDESTKMMVPGKIEWAGVTLKDTKVIRVVLDNGNYIDCTRDHKFLSRSGEWIEAQNLQPNQSLMPLYQSTVEKGVKKGYKTVYHPGTGQYQEIHRMVPEGLGMVKDGSESEYKNHKVREIIELSETIDTGDITISTFHNFATSAGVIVHNSTLAAEDIRFSRTIERIQRMVVSELTKIAIVHLYTQGFKDENLVNFSLSLTQSSNVSRLEKLEMWQTQINIARDAKDLKMLPLDFIYEVVFGFSEQESAEYKEKVVEDVKRLFRLTQIEQEGNDPVKTKRSFGTSHDIAAMHSSKKTNDEDLEEDNDKIDARTISLSSGRNAFNEKSLTNVPGESSKYRNNIPLKKEQVDYKLKQMGLDKYRKKHPYDKSGIISETFDLSDKNENNSDNNTFMDENNIVF